MGIYQNIKKLIEQEVGNVNASNSIMVNTYDDLQTLSDKKEGVFYITKDNDDVYLYDSTSLDFINVNASVSGATIDDVTPSLDKVFSSKKVSDELALKSGTNHTHTELHSHLNKASLDRLGVNANNKLTIDGTELQTGSSGPTIDDLTPSTTTVYSSQKVEDKLSQKAEANHSHTDLHSHLNKASLDRLGVNTEGKVTVDGTAIPSSSVQIDDVTPALDKVYSSKKVSDELALKAASNHTHSEYASSGHNHNGVYEPVISTKGTAFNKNFGTSGTSTDVARADHTHTDYTTVTAVNQIITDSVSFRDSNILLNGSVLETDIDGTKIGIDFNLLAEPVPAVQDGLTADTPFIIQTIQDLQSIPTKGLNKHYKLWNSLDLSGIAEWTPLGIFTGHFNGNGKIISGLKIAAATTINVGLFTELQTGSIKNLTMNSASITTNKVNSGVIVGKKTSGVIENCFVVNSSLTTSINNAGFISGNNIAGSITKSGVLNGTLTINQGGYFASLITGDNRAIIKEVFATGSIACNSSTSYNGAFVGTTGTGSDIDDAYVVATFSGTYAHQTTGFTTSATGTKNNIYTKVNRAKYTFSSGGTLNLVNGFYKVDTFEATPTKQGTEVLDLSNQSAFTGFDFTNLWVMDTAKGRPTLRNSKEDVPLTEPEKPAFKDNQITYLDENYSPLEHSHSEYQTSTQVNTLIKNADNFLDVKDFNNDIQAALNESKTNGLKNVVFVPNGTYRLSTSLKIPSDTTLLLDKEAIITRAVGTLNNLIINDSDGTVGGYEANKNINIIGGIFDGNKGEFNTACTILAFGHAKNIVIKNAVFRNLYDWHLIELNGVQNALISESLFENNGDLVSVGTEMIQIDVFTESTVFPWFGPYDSTPCKKITIENNFFKDGMIAVGTHSHAVNVKHTDIKIKNNHFTNFFKEVIAFKNWQDVYFENNHLDNAFKGFRAFTDGTTTCENINVLYNTFRNMNKDTSGRAIEIKSTETVEKLKKIRVIGNTVDGTGSHAVGADFSDDVIFKDNNIQNAPGVGLWVYGIDNCIVQNNTIKNTNTNNVADRGDIVLGLTTKIPKNIICKDNLVGKLVVNGIQKSIVKDNIVSSIVTLNNDASVIVDNNIIGG